MLLLLLVGMERRGLGEGIPLKANTVLPYDASFPLYSSSRTNPRSTSSNELLLLFADGESCEDTLPRERDCCRLTYCGSELLCVTTGGELLSNVNCCAAGAAEALDATGDEAGLRRAFLNFDFSRGRVAERREISMLRSFFASN